MIFILLNILLGFIIPWIVTLVIVKDRKIIYITAPLASMLAFFINDFGFYFFWNLYPFELSDLAGTPFNLGLFCTFPCTCIYICKKHNFNPYITMLIGSLLITTAEGCGVLMGRVIYFNNWNIFFSFLSYSLPLLLCYKFYELVNRKY